jgi:hypothetical protein
MENGEPEINDFQVQYSGGTFEVTANARHTRNCADCGTELKDCDHDFEGSVELTEFEGWASLTSEQQTAVKLWLESNEAQSDQSDCQVEESGGGRYQKNMIELVLSYSIEIEAENELEPDAAPIKLVYNGTLSNSAAAGEYCECC